MSDLDDDFLRVIIGGLMIAVGFVVLAYAVTALPPGIRVRLVFLPLFAGASDLPYAGWASIGGPVVAYIGWVLLRSGLDGAGEDKRRRAKYAHQPHYLRFGDQSKHRRTDSHSEKVQVSGDMRN